MTTILRSLIATVAAATLAGGCHYEECAVQDARTYRGGGYVVVDSPPPPLQASTQPRPPKPHPNAVWVEPYWDWRGRWERVPGHWETPQPGHVWTPPVARRTPEGRVEYHPGHWRPRDTQPPPVYQQPGDVEVSVRPARPATRVNTPQQPARPARLDVQTPTPARPATPVNTPQQPARPARLDVQTPTPARPATAVNTPRQGGVAPRPARPAQPDGTHPPTVARPQPDVRPAEPARPSVPVRPATPAGVPPTVARPAAVPPTVARPAAVPPTVARPAGVQPAHQRPGTGPLRGPGAERVALSCRLDAARAPGGGYVTLHGRGWGDAPVVKVGGRIATISAVDQTQIRFQVPRNSAGGRVTVSDGDRTASCGDLAVIGR